tara:strand:- start:4561 stop:5097 length:537 start_codon:yes stop_codon:yes gene_type:complete
MKIINKFKEELIKKYNIHAFYLIDGIETTIFVNGNISLLFPVINKNFILLVVGENCIVISILCAIRWEYLKILIRKHYNELDSINGCFIVNITNMVIDSGLLLDINYKNFAKNLILFLHENNGNNMYIGKTELIEWRKFLDLLIPPTNYWKKLYGFGIEEIVTRNNTETNLLPTDFNT